MVERQGSEAGPRIRVGINPLTWSNDDLPELGADIPLEVCLEEARQAGFAGIELGHKFPRDPAVLGPILERHVLGLVSGWYGSRLLSRSVGEELGLLEDHLSLLSALGAAVMVFAEVTGAVHGERETPLSRRPVLPEADWREFGRRLTEVAEHLAAPGVRMAYHYHMGTVVESAADVDRLMRASGEAVGLLLDTGHIAHAGGDPVAIARRHGARINHVHCKDVRHEVLGAARARDSSFLDNVVEGVFTVPGDGSVDFEGVFTALEAAEYMDWPVVEAEQDPNKAHPLTYARMGHSAVHQAMASAGLAA